MANADIVNGLRPSRYMNGAPWTGQCTEYYIPSSDSTAVFVGDLVKFAGSASSDGVATVAQAAASGAVLGVVVGIRKDTPTSLDTPIYRAASTAAYVMVVDDPNVLFEIQEDGVGGALAVTNIGQNADIVVGSGSTTTGASGMELDSSTAATTATLPLKIMGFVRREDNEIGSANAKIVVKLNNHQLGSSTGTAGV